jgi:hypothetical protein
VSYFWSFSTTESRVYSGWLHVMYMVNEVVVLKQNEHTPWPESANELYRPSDRSLSAKLMPTFADRRCHVVSATNLYGRNLSFLDRILFLSSSFSVVLTRLSVPRSRPTTTQKMWQRRESNPGLWICSQELWRLDHRGCRMKWYWSRLFSEPFSDFPC